MRAAADLAVLVLAIALAFLMRFDFNLPSDRLEQLLVVAGPIVLIQFAGGLLFRLHKRSWRYVGFRDALRVAATVAATVVLLLVLRFVVPGTVSDASLARHAAVPITIILSDGLFAFTGMLGLRVLRRLRTEYVESQEPGLKHRRKRQLLLIGAGRAGSLAVEELRHRPETGLTPIGFVDDDPDKQGLVIHGVKVLGTTMDLPRIVEETRPDEAIITIAAASGAAIRKIREACVDVGLPVKIIPGIYEILGGRVELNRIRPVDIEDLLGRKPVQLDTDAIVETIHDEVVLVTGAGGSIGAELCRQVAVFQPTRLVLVDRSEYALWSAHRELGMRFPGLQVVPAIGDVGDQRRMDELILRFGPSVIFHAASHKHVPMLEHNPGEAVKNNVLGTRAIVDIAAGRGVERFVMISTDKAVNPTSIMGATKRLAERYVQHVAGEHGLPYVAVRFGNVLDSTGSVIPVFRDQIARGGPLTVTHPEMVRYFMTIPEAAQLVIQAAAMGEGEEVFVLDMGEPVSVLSLAEDLIRLSGYEPYVEIPIEFTGPRPGEKLFEEINLSDEHATRTRHPKVWIGSADGSWPTLDVDLRELERLAAVDDPGEVRATLATLVPEMASS